MAMSETEARIRRLHARLAQVEHRTETLAGRTGRLDQNLVGFYQVGANFGGRPTTLEGRIVGGLTTTLTPMPDTTLRVVGATTSTDYGTYPVPTGIYSLALGIDPTDTSVNLYPTGPVSPRFAGATPFTWTRSISVGNVNTLAAVIPSAAPGYGYMFESTMGARGCLYPVGALDWDDSRFGIGSSTTLGQDAFGFSSIAIQQSACFVTSSFADPAGSCVARPSTAAVLQLDNFARTFIQFKTSSPGLNCPAALASCVGFFSDRSIQIPASFFTAFTPPSFDLATKYSLTFGGLTNQLFHNSLPRTIRWYEP